MSLPSNNFPRMNLSIYKSIDLLFHFTYLYKLGLNVGVFCHLMIGTIIIIIYLTIITHAMHYSFIKLILNHYAPLTWKCMANGLCVQLRLMIVGILYIHICILPLHLINEAVNMVGKSISLS